MFVWEQVTILELRDTRDLVDPETQALLGLTFAVQRVCGERQ